MLGDNSQHNISRPLTSDWQTVAHVPTLDAGDVHIWLLSIDEPFRSVLETGLSESELERTAAFKFRTHQNQFVVSRGALRFLLGRYLGQPMQGIEILYTESGKPYLSQRHLPNVKFNVSHSEQYAILGFSLGQDLGIDIESEDHQTIDEGLLRQCLTASERLRYEQALPAERTEFFFDLWTRKEAYMKLLGDGLSISPRELRLPPLKSGQQAINGDLIYYTAMPDIEGFSSALATRKQPANVQFYSLGFNLVM